MRLALIVISEGASLRPFSVLTRDALLGRALSTDVLTEVAAESARLGVKVGRLVGLGQMSSADLSELAPKRVPVESAVLSFLEWTILTRPVSKLAAIS